MTLEDAEPGELDTALPAHPLKRDALGQACFIIHFLPLTYVLAGWLAPWRGALIVYLVFVPSVFLQWRLNKSSCVLNNMESLIRTGHWRDPHSREEGAWLRTLIKDRTGLSLSRFQMDLVMNGVMTTLWLVALARLLRWL
jgi:hypothetical protein